MKITLPSILSGFLSTEKLNEALAAIAAALDSAEKQARQARLQSLQATSEDLAARDSLDIRVEVDITARRVRVLDANSDTLAQHRIAVGSKDWPTRPGEWSDPTWC